MSPTEYTEVKREDFPEYAQDRQAAHCMIYTPLPHVDFEQNPVRAAVLMQMRFDGHVGFPGGLIETGEEVVHGLIREMQEEINFYPQPNEIAGIKHIVTHWHSEKKVLLHFFVCEVSQVRMREIERGALDSRDHGGEVMGTFRVPLYTMSDGCRGFPTFIQNSFVGNAYEQLKVGLLHAAILSEDEFKSAEAALRTPLSKLS